MISVKKEINDKMTDRSKDEGQRHLRKWFVYTGILHAVVPLSVEPHVVDSLLNDWVSIEALVAIFSAFLASTCE